MKRKYHIIAKNGLLTSDITIVITKAETSFFTQLVCRLHNDYDVNMDDVLKIEQLEV